MKPKELKTFVISILQNHSPTPEQVEWLCKKILKYSKRESRSVRLAAVDVLALVAPNYKEGLKLCSKCGTHEFKIVVNHAKIKHRPGCSEKGLKYIC